MLLDIKTIIDKYKISVRGVIHIGAHIGQEHNLYKEIGVNDIIYFEPLLENFKQLKENVKDDALLFNVALGNFRGRILMNVETANQRQSSSILTPQLHVLQYPWITFDHKEEVEIDMLDEIDFDRSKYNMINIDVQGYELEALRGSSKTLEDIDYIISEVNRGELYQNCAKVEELDDFLKNYGFNRVETNWAGNTWGDALYIKGHDGNLEN